MKTLEYIFHGLPLGGLAHAVEGLPLSSPEELLLTPDTESLIAGIGRIIDDFEQLNRMRERSLEVCEKAFRWEDRGQKLADAIAQVRDVVLPG